MGKKQYLTGQRFGNLTVMYEGKRGENGRIRWHCKCDCGNERDVPPYNLTKGITTSCGCTYRYRSNYSGIGRCGRHGRDIAGQRFGMLTAINPTDKRMCGQIVWLCRCDCGNYTEVAVSNLTNGSTKSCGCNGLGRGKVHDLTGMKFGKLTVLEKTDKRYYKKMVWRCQCDCGNICEAVGNNLLSGRTQSCGCLRRGPNQKVKSEVRKC